MDCVHDIRGDGVCDRCGAEIFSHEGLKQDLRKIYERIPELPVREETMWAATDALTALCIMLGNHGIETKESGTAIDEARRWLALPLTGNDAHDCYEATQRLHDLVRAYERLDAKCIPPESFQVVACVSWNGSVTWYGADTVKACAGGYLYTYRRDT